MENLNKNEAKPTKFVVPKKIYKKNKYLALLRLIKERKFTTIKAVSKILGIRYQTLQLWMKTPQIQHALIQEIDYYVESMKEAGKTDWRMWDRLIQYATGDKKEDEERKNNQKIIIIHNEKEFKIGYSEDED